MRRREFILRLGVAAAWPIAAHAQPAERIRRLGVLTPLAENHPDAQARHATFLDALGKLGWTDGRNVRIEARWSAGDAAVTAKHAAELARLAPDVILASGGAGGGSNPSGDPLRANRVRKRS